LMVIISNNSENVKLRCCVEARLPAQLPNLHATSNFVSNLIA